MCQVPEQTNADVPVAVIRNTGQSVVPSQESGHNTKSATRLDERWAWRAFRSAYGITEGEEEESEIKCEEEEEEGDRRTEGEEGEDGGEDEPTLGR